MRQFYSGVHMYTGGVKDWGRGQLIPLGCPPFSQKHIFVLLPPTPNIKLRQKGHLKHQL